MDKLKELGELLDYRHKMQEHNYVIQIQRDVIIAEMLVLQEQQQVQLDGQLPLIGTATVTQCYNKGKVTGSVNVGEIIGFEKNNDGSNTLNKLFYLRNNNNLNANGLKEDNVENQIMAVDDNLTYEQFKTWIKSQ